MKAVSILLALSATLLVSCDQLMTTDYSDDGSRYEVQSVTIYAEAPFFDFNSDPDIYYKVLDMNNVKIYESSHGKNETTFNHSPNNLILLRYEEYTFEIWDHDLIGDHDMITKLKVTPQDLRTIDVSNNDASLTLTGRWIN